MRRLFAKPLDVLMFRSERPFTARESHVAKVGVISHLVFEGAIKSKVFYEFCKSKSCSPAEFQRAPREGEEEFLSRVRTLAEKDNELERVLSLIGHPAVNASSQIILRGVFFAKDKEFSEYFPMPNDIAIKDKENSERKEKRDEEIVIQAVKLAPKENIKNIIKYGSSVNVMLSKHLHIMEASGLLSFEQLIDYLKGEVPERKLPIPYAKETRVGIALEKGKKKTVEGAFYTAEFIRLLEDWGFIVWYKAPEGASLEGTLKLGGEGRGAIFKMVKDRALGFSELIKKINEDGKFKLYLATPSHFNGPTPPLDELKSVLGVDALTLIGALPGKPVYIGGYDFALNKEKPLQRWVNAGAVYNYSFEGKINEDLPLPIHVLRHNINMGCAFIGRL